MTMILRLPAIALLCALGPVAAEARPRAAKLHPDCNITMPCVLPDASTPRQARATRGRYIARQLGIGGPREPAAVRPRQATAKRAQMITRIIPEPVASAAGSIGRPLRYIAGRLICAINVNAALAERGIRGTGSALAHSFDRWGRASAPQPGAVAVTDRRGGGHVAIVSRVEGGRVYVWNPSPRGRGWRELDYTNRRARYRVAG